MEAEELRSIQAPLKQKYRDDPDSAMVAARAEGEISMAGVSCNIRSWRGEVEAGLHPAGGGNGGQACSADLLLQALIGCAGVTFASVAIAMDIPIRAGRVIAEGKWDARGTLGVDRTVPVGLTEVKITFEIDSDAEPRKLARAVEMAEKYCVVSETLRHPPEITFGYTVTTAES